MGTICAVSWTRYEGHASGDASLTGEALFAALEDLIRAQNPHLCDVRLERALATEGDDAPAATRLYRVVYLADDGSGGV